MPGASSILHMSRAIKIH